MLRKISLVYMTFIVFAAGMADFFMLFSDQKSSYERDGSVAIATAGVEMMILGFGGRSGSGHLGGRQEDSGECGDAGDGSYVRSSGNNWS